MTPDVKRQLTLRFRDNTEMSGFREVKLFGSSRKGKIPVHRHAIKNPEEYFDAVIKRNFTPVMLDKPTFNAKLRDYQIEAVSNILGEFARNGDTDVFFKAPCGSGKTVMAIAAMVKLGTRTFITTPNSKIRDQWVEEIGRFTNLKVAKYTAAKHDKLEAFDVCVGNVQAIMKSDKDFSRYSLLMVDEAHGSSADVWSRHIGMFSGRRMLITATPIRADGLDIVLQAHCGEVSVSVEPDRLRDLGYILEPYVLFLRYNKTYDVRLPWDREVVDYNATLNQMTDDVSRRKFILGVAKRYEAKGHNILFISKRLKLTHWFSDAMGNCSLMTGKSKEVMLRHVSGSEKIVKEGLDKPDLSVAFVLTPVGNEAMFEQIAGRVCRIHDDKPQRPVVVVLVDSEQPLMDVLKGRVFGERTYSEVSFVRNYRFCTNLGYRVFIDEGEDIIEVLR